MNKQKNQLNTGYKPGTANFGQSYLKPPAVQSPQKRNFTLTLHVENI